MERILLAIFFMNLFSRVLFSQEDYLMTLTNGEQTKSDEIEFDVYIKSTDSSFNLTSYQCSFTCNSGNLTSPLFSYVPGSSQLINFPRNGIGIRKTDGVTEMTFASSAGNEKVDTAQVKVGRFRFKNSTRFPAEEFQISWNFSGIINTIITGAGFTDITHPSNHINMVFYPDTISPELRKAACVDINKVTLEFSEELEETSALPCNFSIDNGITINDVSFSPDGRCVILTTSPHTLNKIYTVTVSGVSDRSGNSISSELNTVQYSYNILYRLSVKLFLEGPYKNGTMETHLSSLKLIPKTQPYSSTPWMYNGNEYADSISGNIVDWMLVELRRNPDDSAADYRTAALLRNDGILVDLFGNYYITFINLTDSSYYLVVRHRNHLPVISSVPVILGMDFINIYDFSSSDLTVHGNNSAIKLSKNIYGVPSGDADGNGVINTADYYDVWKQENGTIGYKAGDFDLNGGVNIADKNLYWKINNGKVLHVH